MTAKWQAGHTYVPGDLVVPASGTLPPIQTPENPGFEEGDFTGWTPETAESWQIADGTNAYEGSHCLQYVGDGDDSITCDTWFDVKPGTRVSAQIRYKAVHDSDSGNEGRIVLLWFDADKDYIGKTDGSWYGSPGQHGGSYRLLSVSDAAPSGARYAKASLWGSRYDGGGTGYFDNLTVSVSGSAPAGLVFRATQAAPGKSGASEPAWPSTTGIEVTDNEVTWEGVIATRLVWEASPLLESGATEPSWPGSEGSMVRDGTIDWEAFTPQAKDAPASPIVTVGANKVFVGDGDIVQFCATNDALDWATENDAGYLPTGLWAVGETECTALGIYRGNLTVWTASSMQVWQIDPDPSRMSIIDTVEGAGASYVRASTGMMNDLFFLSRLGIRSVGITATTGTMGATDVGSPVDPLVRAALADLPAGIDPLSVFYANASQLWAFMGDTAYVYAVSAGAKVYAWSEYGLPWTVTDACVLDGRLYVRTTDHDVFVLDESRFTDDAANGATTTNYTVEVQWPWLDLGAPGVEKMLDALDVVIEVGDSEAVTGVSIGYDERDTSAFTEPVMIGGDTRPGDPVPVPVAAVSMAPKLTHTSDQPWSISALTLYHVGMGPLR